MYNSRVFCCSIDYMFGYVCNEFSIVDVVLHNYLCSVAMMLVFLSMVARYVRYVAV